MIGDFLELIPDLTGKFLRENFRRIEEWSRRIITRLDIVDGGGP